MKNLLYSQMKPINKNISFKGIAHVFLKLESEFS